jgi:small subunit ribosomal protein S2
MALPEFTLRQLLEAGVHFGHQTSRWNPRMGEFIYGTRNGIHIIDLTQTVPMLDAALNVIRDVVAKGGSVLFVGTKRQAQKPIADAAEKCAQYYMNHRWLGGTLTNWQTVSKSIDRLKEIDEKLETGADGMTKKERLGLERMQFKLQSSLGGIREMTGRPDLIFVIDVNKEDLAIAEAKKLGIPVVAVVDTNCPPDKIDYIIPGNDDASRAISLYCDLVARAALDGMSAQLGAAGVDIGALDAAPLEDAVTEPEVVKEAPAKKVAAKDEPAKEKSTKEEPAKETAMAETAKKEPAKAETAKEEQSKKEPAAKEDAPAAKEDAPAAKEADKDAAAKKKPDADATAAKEVDAKEPAKKPEAKKAPAKKVADKKPAATSKSGDSAKAQKAVAAEKAPGTAPDVKSKS